MSIIKVSELGKTSTVTTGSLFYVAYGDGPTYVSKHITEQDLLGQYATTGSNSFVGDQNITGSLYINTTPVGTPNDLAMVIDPTTKLVSYVSQNLKTVFGLYTQTANSEIITATTNERSLIGSGVGSLFIPANGFSIGDSYRGYMGGVVNMANNETLRLRIKTASGVLLGDSGLQELPAISNNVWTLETNFTVRQVGSSGVASIVSIGRFQFNKSSNGGIEGFAFNTVNNSTFNTTVDNTLAITIEFGSNNSTNAIYSDIFTLTKVY